MRPRFIEWTALGMLGAIAVAGVLALRAIPTEEFTRREVLSVLEVCFAALGFVSLVLVWAQLRHTATLSKLRAYHEYFHDLPSAAKVGALYAALGRLNIPVPLWQAPLTDPDLAVLLADVAGAPDTAALVTREYLNDFEEFAAAVNCGLVDKDYAYHLEGTRALNAYFGFRVLILHWLAEDRSRAERAGEAGPTATNYYGELRKLAEHWKDRKHKEAKKAARGQQSIPQRL